MNEQHIVLPPLPAIDGSRCIKYESIRYVAGYDAAYVGEYAQQYAKMVLAAVLPEKINGALLEALQEVLHEAPVTQNNETAWKLVHEVKVNMLHRPPKKTTREQFMQWAVVNLGGGYSRETDELGRFGDPVTRWAEIAFRAGQDRGNLFPDVPRHPEAQENVTRSNLAGPLPSSYAIEVDGELIEPEAFKFVCKRAPSGGTMVYASIVEDDTQHYPLSQWREVTKVPLYSKIDWKPPQVSFGADWVAKIQNLITELVELVDVRAQNPAPKKAGVQVEAVDSGLERAHRVNLIYYKNRVMKEINRCLNLAARVCEPPSAQEIDQAFVDFYKATTKNAKSDDPDQVYFSNSSRAYFRKGVEFALKSNVRCLAPFGIVYLTVSQIHQALIGCAKHGPLSADTLIGFGYRQNNPKLTGSIEESGYAAWIADSRELSEILLSSENSGEEMTLMSSAKLGDLIAKKATLEKELQAGPGMGWVENVTHLLNNCKYTVRQREGGGPECLVSTLIVTFQKMQDMLERPPTPVPEPRVTSRMLESLGESLDLLEKATEVQNRVSKLLERKPMSKEDCSSLRDRLMNSSQNEGRPIIEVLEQAIRSTEEFHYIVLNREGDNDAAPNVDWTTQTR